MNSPAPEFLPSSNELEELAHCADERELSDYLRAHPRLLTIDVVRQLAEAVRQRLRVNLEQGFRLAEAALAIASILKDPESLGFGARAKANALWSGGKLHEAVELFQIAIGHFEDAGATAEVGRTLSSSIQPLMLLGEYGGALEAAERARVLFRRNGDLWRLARLEINVGNIHERQARFTEALGCYRLAYEQLQPYKDQEAMVAALHNMAVCLIILNDFHEALETYRRARKAAEKNQMPLLVAQADYNVAYLYFLRGDYQKALEGLRATQKLYQENGALYHSALCDLDQSEILLELNLSGEAARLAGRAQNQFEKLGTALESGRAVVNSAIAFHQQQESLQALDLFCKAAAIFANEKNHAWLALVEIYRALALLETGQAETAAEPCAAALQFFTSAGLTRRAVVCCLLMARIALARGRLPEAQQHCESALQKLVTAEAPLLSYHAHLILGDVHKAFGRPRQSKYNYQHARRNLETLRGSVQGEELKISFMKNKVEVYEKLVRASLETHRRGAAEKAFGYMEQAKSRSLVELVFGRGNALRKDPGERIATLEQELNWYYRRLEIEQTRATGISLAQIQELQSQARAREDELMRAIREMPPRKDGEHALETPGRVTLDDVRAALGAETTLLEYFQIESRLVAAVVTRRELDIFELGEVSEITAATRMLDFQLSHASANGHRRGSTHAESLLAATNHHLHELYRMLVLPLAGKLTNPRLLVVPHGPLHYIPFHALFDGGSYLIDRFTVTYAPSATMYTICQRKREAATGPPLLLGVPDKRAPSILHEIRSVASVLPQARVRLGRDATAHELKTAGASSRLIHIATHAVFRGDNPMFSSVRLADCYLNIYDLYQLHLPAELLTLSGCGTGLSVVAAGDELLGLVRGLLSAGAHSLLLSLWDVHDRTAAELMAYFYSKFETHDDKGAVLREAMLELRRSHPHPYYWAPFVLIGRRFFSSG